MRNPRDFAKPLAIGAPDPVLEIPFKPSRMIHFLDFSNEKMVAKVPDIAPTVDILLGNLEDAVPVDRKEAAREGLVRVGKEMELGDTQLWTRVNSLESPWVLDDITTLVTRDRRQARRDDDPQGRGAVGHPLRRPAARPARGEGRARAADPDPRDPRDRPRRRQPRGDRHRQPADAGDELRPRRPRRLAADEDHARRRRPPGLPGDRGPRPRRSRARRAPPRSRTRGTTRSRGWSTPARRPGSSRSTAPTATSATSQGCETQFRAAFLLGCVGAWSLHPVQIEIAKKVFSPDPDEVAVRQEGARGDPRRARRPHDRRQDAGRRDLEAVQGDGRARRDARAQGSRARRGLRLRARRRPRRSDATCGSRPRRTTRSGPRSSWRPPTDEKPVKAERIATAQGIPLNFLENILGELRHAGIVRSQRGAEGGFRLAKPADQITVADVIRAVEGPLASVRGGPPEDAAYGGAARRCRGSGSPSARTCAAVVEHVTLADVAAGQLPPGDRQARRGPGGLGHALGRGARRLLGGRRRPGGRT